MPALTIPAPSTPLDDSLNLPSGRDLPNPYPRHSLPRPQRHPPDVAYTHAHFDGGGGAPYYERVYPPLFSSQFTASPPSSAMFSYLALPQAPANWQPHIQLLHHNPYPSPQPPQLVHKVWILDCRSCGTFLTNRGMKAVLLLRPNVSLFSTDALPINCSAYSTNPDALRPPPCRPSAASPSPRTCECLTQTLCCHTCGTAVGYMIVIPCVRCTSSISTTNRATNGHRFVFHSSEIMASERYHVPDEPGVLPVEYPTGPPPPSSPPPLTPAYPAALQPIEIATHRRASGYAPSQGLQSFQASPSSLGTDYHLSPGVESPDLVSAPIYSSPHLLASIAPTSPRRSPRPVVQTSFPHDVGPQTLLEASGTSGEPCPRKLRAGEVLYWHHLAKNGEIPEVQEDPRARISSRGETLRFLER